MKITDITRQYDVCVCGGGPAGVCAAIAAAEAGADTVLIEKNGMLGGIWTSGLLSWILDCKGKNGILRRLMTRLEEEGTGRFARGGNFLALPENTKLALEDMALSAGVNVLLYTQICSAKAENGRIKSVKCCGKEGLFDLSAKVFIDCTGDGDLGFFAGCTYAYGGEDGRAQPMTLVALVDGIDPEAAHKFDNALPYPEGKPNAKAVTLSHMRSLGIEPTYGSPSLWHISDSLWLMMTQQEYGYDPAKSASLSAATLEARRELDAQVRALRAGGGVFSKMRLVMTAPSIGVRESRRLLGKYTLSDSDLAEGKTFDDAVCEVRFGVDIHPTASGRTFEEEKKNYTVKPYEIPLRCLLSAEFDNLLMAGRCISGSFAAHASYRVTGDAAVTGEAAGRKAAQMAKA